MMPSSEAASTGVITPCYGGIAAKQGGETGYKKRNVAVMYACNVTITNKAKELIQAEEYGRVEELKSPWTWVHWGLALHMVLWCYFEMVL